MVKKIIVKKILTDEEIETRNRKIMEDAIERKKFDGRHFYFAAFMLGVVLLFALAAFYIVSQYD